MTSETNRRFVKGCNYTAAYILTFRPDILTSSKKMLVGDVKKGEKEMLEGDVRCHEFVLRSKSDVRCGFLLLGLDIKKRAK